jgi:hypothetical protein
LVVVVSSPEDEASADKLAELIREPFARVASASAPPPTAAAGCRTSARLELHLDSVGQAVRLVRCRDATVLARGLDPDAARQTPYLSAFVAAELLAINRELEAVEARSAEALGSSPELAGPAPAADSGSGAAPAPAPPEPARSLLELQLRAGAELTLWGAPFDHAVRPSFGFGLNVAPTSPAFAWVFELSVGLFALAEQKRMAELLALQRHDGQLQAGVRFLLGPLHVAGFALGRVSLTSAEYSADLQASSRDFRFGVGAGLEADMPLGASFAVYTQAKLDVATSRSEYRVPGRSSLRDPASLLWLGVGLLVRFSP